ncbi:hypothetical protein BR93DRAFT_82143 [Coniochaeta sp. PMI_546]|nr:hypothetical protein BR93DRAFT_82143 [Coniochaeta sp. PMI_546]
MLFPLEKSILESFASLTVPGHPGTPAPALIPAEHLDRKLGQSENTEKHCVAILQQPRDPWLVRACPMMNSKADDYQLAFHTCASCASKPGLTWFPASWRDQLVLLLASLFPVEARFLSPPFHSTILERTILFSGTRRQMDLMTTFQPFLPLGVPLLVRSYRSTSAPLGCLVPTLA